MSSQEPSGVGHDRLPARRGRHRAVWVLMLLVLVGPPVCLWFHASATKRLDADEGEHAHAVYLLAQGQTPYVDFFEHHPPLLYHLALPLYRVHGDSSETLLLLRGCMAAALVVCLLALLAAGWQTDGDPWSGVLAATAWSTMVLVAVKGVEFRPDPPALAAAAAGLALYLYAGGPARLSATLGAALLWGVAGALTQKAVFPFLGLSVFHLLACLHAVGASPRQRAVSFLLWPLAAALPFGLTAITYAMLPGAPVPPPHFAPAWVWSLPGALPTLLDRAIFWNLHWQNHFSPLLSCGPTLRQNTAFWLLALVGTGLALRAARREGPLPILAPALTALGALGGLALIPVPYPQYYLWVALPSALTAGYATTRLFGWLRGLPSANAWRRAALVLLALLTLVLPFVLALRATSESNRSQLATLATFAERVPSTAKVLDGWSGLGVFHRSAWYYHFLHLEIRKMLPEEVQSAGALQALAQADVVIRDDDIRALPEAVQQRIERDFHPETPWLWRRNSPP